MSELVKAVYTQEDMLDTTEVKVQFPDEDYAYWFEQYSAQYTNGRLVMVQIIDQENDNEILTVPAKMVKAVR